MLGCRAIIRYPVVVPTVLPRFFTLAVDLVVLTIRDGRLNVLVIERDNPPFRSRFALPGGFVRPEEDLEVSALRELHEETSIQSVCLEQVQTYGSPKRDPRGRVASVAYLVIAPNLPMPVAGTDAAAAQWMPIADCRHLAFDHDTILRDALDGARAKLEHTPTALDFCPETFTLAELQRVYETVWDLPLDPRTFRRDATRIPGFVTPTGTRLGRVRNRSIALYRRGNATVLYPPMRRSLPPTAATGHLADAVTNINTDPDK